MDVELLRAYCLSKKGGEETFPFDADTLVFKVMGKMFALLPLERLPLQINLKSDPERAEELRAEYEGDIVPGYHMSKTHWNTVYPQRLPRELVFEMIDRSFDLVVAGLTKKQRAQWEAL